MLRNKSRKRKEKIQYLRVSGILLPDNRLMLKPSYLSCNPRGAVNLKNSPLQIELYHGKKLILRWGTSLSLFYKNRVIPIMNQESLRKYTPIFDAIIVRAKVPFPPVTDRIVYNHENIILKEIPVPKKDPIFSEDIKIKKAKGNSYLIEWHAEHPENLPIFYHVRTSADGGRTWKRLASRLARECITLPRDALAGAKRCILEVVAYDGVNTSASRIRVQDAPPAKLKVYIVSPMKGKKLNTSLIELRALCQIFGRQMMANRRIKYVWKVNGKKIAETPAAILDVMEAGKYKITIEASLGKLKGKDSIDVNIVDSTKKK